jgi:hypothetical protein
VAAQLSVAAFLGILAAVGAVLVLSWALAASTVWQRPSLAPLALWLLGAALAFEWLRRLGRRGMRWDRRAAASEIEGTVGLPRGSVQGAVEPGADREGASLALLDLHRGRIAEVLDGKRYSEMRGASARAARGRALSAAVLMLAALGGTVAIWLVDPQAAGRAWADVRHPVRHLDSPPLPRIVLVADSLQVRRGRDLGVRVEAAQRDSVLLLWRPRGEVPNRRWLSIDQGRAGTTVPRIEAPTAVWATAADGAVSDTLHVEPIDPLLLVDAQVELRYPSHTGREREILGTPFPPLTVPEGTRATVSGSATLPLRQAALASASGEKIGLAVREERRFAASFTVRAGTWGWALEGEGGEKLEGEPDSIEFRTLADSAPQVQVLYPGVDTVLSTAMVQSLIVDARDDYGLSSVELVSWRISVWGERWPERVDSLSLGEESTRANLAATLDATGRGLLPGDTLRYYVRAYDNAPSPQEGRSREYALRLPTLDEIRERTVAQTRDLVESAENLAERARDHQQSTESLQRSLDVQPPPGAPAQGARPREALEFSETQAARQSLEEAADLLEQARQIEESLRELKENMERAGMNDSSLVERMREIESLFERVITPELAERIQELREALTELDPERLKEAIRQLAEGSADFRQRVEQTLELLRRAALEQQFGALEAQARELREAEGRLQEAIDSAARSDSALGGLDRQADEMARKAEDLARRIEELTGDLQRAGEESAAEQSGEAVEQADSASRSNEQVARSLPRDPSRASESARRGGQQLERAATALREGREQMQSRWRQQVVEAMTRAQTEALELARRQGSLNEAMRSNEPGEAEHGRSEQGALRRGVEQIEEQLAQAARSTLLLDPELLQATARAGAEMDEILAQMSGGGGSRPSAEQGRRAVESLNDLAYRLMQAQDAAASAASGTGLQEALEQLSQLAEQQGRLNSGVGEALPLPMGEALLQELQRLAARQQAIARELQQLGRSLGPRGQVLGGLDEMGAEAEEISQELERGRVDEELVQRQRRLFQRLLDAGRTLEQDEFERERRAERPEGTEIFRPGELPPELFQGLRYPHPESERLRSYAPVIRRLILEYFDLLNGRGGAGEP